MTVRQGVTRIEIAEALSGVFDEGGADRDDILAAAAVVEDRPEIALVLENLPERRYWRLNQLWEELADIPVGV